MDTGKKNAKQGKKEMHARVSRSIEELSRIYWEEVNLDGLRICRGSIGQTESFSMDWEAVKKLLRQSLENSMDQKCDTICREKKSKGLNRWESVEKLSSLIKKSFSRRGKTPRDECNQASYSNIDLINMLSSQKHLSTKKNAKHSWSKTHTHKQNKSNQFYISKISQDILVSKH